MVLSLPKNEAMKNQEREPSAHHLLEAMLSFKKLLRTTFQVLILTGVLLVSLVIFLATPTGTFLLPSLSSFRHCSTFLEGPVIAQCLIHLLHFAVHAEACLSGRPLLLSSWFRRFEEEFLTTVRFTIMLLLVWNLKSPEKLHRVVLPPTISDAMVQAAADRCLLRSGVCQNLRRRPDYLSIFSYTTNQSLLTSLERRCCGPPSWCDSCRTKSSGTCQPTAQMEQESWRIPLAGPLCEAWDLHMKDDPSYEREPCYEAYADGLKKGWLITVILSELLQEFTAWINRVAFRLWVTNYA